MSDDFRLQLSVKIDGQHLLNIRAGDFLEFATLLRSTVDDAELILSTARALEGAPPKPERFQPASTPRFVAPAVPGPSNRASGPSGEVGPVLVKSVSKNLFTKDNVKMANPKYTVEFGNGEKISTFKGLLGQAAQTLEGQMVFYSTEPGSNPKYTNLSNIRSAG